MLHVHGDRGAAFRAIALHGWFGDGAGFASSLSPVLDPARFSIAFMDYRGYGAARPSPGPFDLETISRDALAAADQLNWETFSLIGHSMGGKAALRIAVDAPDRVERIVGVTPVWAGAAPFDPDTLAFFRSAPASLDARTAIIDQTTGLSLPSHWVRRIAEQSLEVSERDAFAGYLEHWALDDFSEQAAAIDVPILVIAGARDAGVPPEWVEASWKAALPQTRVEILAETGHYPMDECAPRLGRLIASFLDPEGAR